MNNLAIIPARGGSKRIPKKNIRPFAGRPMIAYAIKSAKESNIFSDVVVSTDDVSIAEISKELGANVPFLRPSELADDHTATVPAVAHAIKECEDKRIKFDNVCCIYPSVPFLTKNDLIKSFALFQRSKNKYCLAIAEFSSSVFRSFKINEKGLEPIFPEFEMTRSQDLDCSYYDVGQFYWGHKITWLEADEKKEFGLHQGSIGFEIESWRSFDIDTLDDWKRAENYYKVIKGYY